MIDVTIMQDKQDGNPYILLYVQGQFDTPLAILSQYEWRNLNRKIEKLEKEQKQ